MITAEDYASHDGLGLAELVRSREVSSVELVEAAIAAIEAWNPALNAVVHRMDERARREARTLDADPARIAAAPFAGVPILVKDAGAAVAGEPLTASCRLLGDYVPDHDSELIARLRAAGLIIVGKTNTPELAAAAVTESKLRGPSRNPWDPARTPGGSSGGSAAAVAARITPLAHGGDGGGSLRIPGSCCGLVALKPSRGRNPAGPDAAEAWGGLVQEHVLTRSVRDSAAALDATAGIETGAPYTAPPAAGLFLEEVGRGPGRLRIAVTDRSLFGREVHADCAAARDDAVLLCEGLGHEVVDGFPAFDASATRRAFLTLVAVGVAAAATRAERAAGDGRGDEELESGTRTLVTIGRLVSAVDYATALDACHAARRAVSTFMEERAVDVLVTSTLAFPPLEVGAAGMGADQWAAVRGLEEAAGAPATGEATDATAGAGAARLPYGRLAQLLEILTDRATEWVGNAALFNVTGQPAVSLPLWWNGDGLPIGVQFASRYGDEASLFRLASQLEQARPWSVRRPQPITV